MLRRISAVAAAAFLAAATMATATATPATAASGLQETGTTSYVLVPDKGVLHVTIELTLRNTQPDTVGSPFPCASGTCQKRTRYVVNSLNLSIESNATSLATRSDAGAVTSSVTQQSGVYNEVKLSFPDLAFGQTRRLTIDYDAPGGKPRSNVPTRVGQAYSSFCVVGHGIDSGSVSVTLPSSFQATVTAGSQLKASQSNGKTVYSSGTVSDPGDLWSCLQATNPAGLTNRSVTAGGRDFLVRGWPEDPQWSDTVSQGVATDIPRLQDLIGLPLPVAGKIAIQEAAAAELGDYSGEFAPAQRTAFVSEQATPTTVAHELSHLWFNSSLFAPVWLDEGFARYAEQVASPNSPAGCQEPGPYPGGGQPNLAQWRQLTTPSTKQDQDVVDYQYAAACYVVSQVAGSIGPDRLREVLSAAAGHEIAYRGSGPAESTGSTEVSSRQWLDLVDELGMVPAGSGDLDFAQNLLARYGILTDSTELAARSAARGHYHQLATRAGGWSLPLAIRQPMAAWQFPGAETAIGTANSILGDRDRVRALIPSATLDGTDVEQRFEGAKNQSDLAALLADADALVTAAQRVASAQASFGAGRNPVEAIGLLGVDVRPQLDLAAAAVAHGDAQAASSAAAQVSRSLADASQRGAWRIAVAVAALALALLLGAVLVWVVRRRGGRAGALPPGAAAMMASGGTPEETPAFETASRASIEPLAPDTASRDSTDGADLGG